MVDFRKSLEEKKAALLAEAQKAAREIDADLAAIDAHLEAIKQLSAKHGLQNDALVPPPGHQQPSKVDADTRKSQIKFQRNPNSPYSRAKIEGEQIIRDAGQPVPFGELYKRLVDRGINFATKDPKAALSAYLGSRTNMYSIKGVGWWIQGEPLPQEVEGQLPLDRKQTS